jgi:hypothetical protein
MRALSALAAALAVLIPSTSVRAQQPLRPVNLEQLNTAADEDDPHLSADRLRLFYARREGGRFQLYLSERRTPAQAWTAGKPLDGPDGEARSPFLTPDGHDFYYALKIPVRDPEGDLKKVPDNFDLVHAIHLGRSRGFTAPVPVQSVCTAADELFPWLTSDGRELFFSRKTKDGWQLFVAGRPGKTGAFGEPKPVAELPAGFHHATLSRDGRTMFLQGPLEGGRWGLFRSTRNGVGLWARPEPLEALNCPEAATGDGSPCLSLDGLKLYFASDRPGGKGGRDLWVIDTDKLSRGR